MEADRVDDAIVVGGSYAGLSAALQLARARRRVCVIDDGQRRNRGVRASHGFLGQDGRAPERIVEVGKAQLTAYPTVTWLDDTAIEARAVEPRVIEPRVITTPDDIHQELELVLAGGERRRARRLVLATGIVDDLPAIPGLVERWGRSVFHCPYCHGYELDGGAIAAIAGSPRIEHLARLLPDWGPTTLFAEDVELEPILWAAIAARGVTIERTRIAAVEGGARGVDLRLADGRVCSFAGAFTTTCTRLADDLAAQLGCELEDGPAGSHLKVNGAGATSVPGVYACGDNAVSSGSVSIAVGDGARTGIAVHQSLILR
ncbi:MAG TPA: NAD(P)/FAD-dependent oxidoreductase [Kofleriaceae bacterium]|nr:NAD(P)/FAD-dependent oxidoreductase [Kofleriaceae bacterium]